MNEKIKKFFAVIGSFVISIFVGLVAIVLHNRRATGEVRTELDRAKSENNDARRTVADVESTVGELQSSVESSQSIIADIRKQRIEDSVDY